jgi:peptidyl-prolyl cis-trans isomerase A (cyclophilin A)
MKEGISVLRKLSMVAALIIGVVALAAINKHFVPKIDPEGVKKQEETEKKIKEAREKKNEPKKESEEEKDGEKKGDEETVDVAHILVLASGDEAAWAKAKEKIDAALARVKAGEDFGKVASEVSEDPGSKQKGGAYPNTPHGKMVPEFDKVMFATPVGEVSEPFRTSYGWHILKVTGRHGTKKAEAPAADAKSAGAVPDVFKVKFETTKGAFVVECHKDWAPLGAARFYELIQQKYYDDNRFFRVAKGFVVQWGIAGDPAVSAKWRDANIQDEPAKEPNKLGTITFAKGGPNTRTTQVFINLKDNSSQLDAMGFAAFGKVIEGMDVINALNGKYGEDPTETQQQIQFQGNAFLDTRFPGLDGIKTAQIIP